MKSLLYTLLAIIGFIMLIVSLVVIFNYHVNYVKVDATVLKYKNGGKNISLSGKEHWSLRGEELVFGYEYEGKYYETPYLVFISNDYNSINKIGSTSKIKIDPKNPQEIIWKLDRTPYFFSLFGLCFIILSFRKIKSRKDSEHLEN